MSTFSNSSAWLVSFVDNEEITFCHLAVVSVLLHDELQFLNEFSEARYITCVIRSLTLSVLHCLRLLIVRLQYH